MEKKISKYSLLVVFGLISGALIFQYYNCAERGNMPGPPEGYEETVDRVEKLKIDDSVSEYYDENLDLFAFGPGSGWLKFKARYGLSPVLSFDCITQSDIRQFNRFSKSIGLPIRVAFCNRVLSVSSTVTGDENHPHLSLRRDVRGKVYLVKIDRQKRIVDNINTQKIVVAQK